MRKPPNAGKGRKKGVPNKTTKSVRDSILEAFTKVGGVKWLVTFAGTHPAEFARLLGRLLPREVQVSAPTGSPPAALDNPTVLAAALALDLAANDANLDPTGAGAPHAPVVPVGPVPPHAPSGFVEVAHEATAAPGRDAVPPAPGDDPAAAR